MLVPMTIPGIVVLEDNPRATGFHGSGETVDRTVVAPDDSGTACGEPPGLAVENLSAATAVDTQPTALGGGRFRVTMGTQGGVARLVVTACGHTAAPGRLLFNTAPPPGGGGEGQWVLTPVTAGNTAGFFPQIALDASGLPHVVSLNYVGGAEVYEYATRGPAGWTSETISTAAQTCGGNTGVLSDIVVDDAGIPHVSLEIPDQAIQHGVRNGGWTVEDVSTTLCPFSGPSADQAFAFVGHNAIAADRASDTIWIVGWFWDGIAQRYAVAAWETGDVATTQIDGGTVGGDTYTGRHPSVAVDATGVVHVAWEGYAGSGESLIRHARWNGSTFEVDTVATMGGANSGKTAVVTVDGTGRPHVVYFEPGAGYKHAVWNGAGWDLEVITTDSAAARQAWMDVAVDGSDRLHVVYSRSDGDVRYTRGTTGAWSAPEVIAQDGDNPALAVTPSGTPHIVFRDPSADQLVHASAVRVSTWRLRLGSESGVKKCQALRRQGDG